MKYSPRIALAFGIALMSSSIAFADDIEVSVTTEFVTEYIFRGATFAGYAFQPGAEISYNNVTIGAWASLPTGTEGDSFADEIRMYASYLWGFNDKVDITTGLTLYHFPQSGGLFDFGVAAGDASTIEVYGAIDFDVPLSPALTAYYDVDLKSFTGIARMGHSYYLTPSASFDIDAEAGFVTSDTGTDYEWTVLSGSMNWYFSDKISAYTSINYGINTEDLFIDTNFDPNDPASVGPARDNNLWYGAGLKFGF